MFLDFITLRAANNINLYTTTSTSGLWLWLRSPGVPTTLTYVVNILPLMHVYAAHPAWLKPLKTFRGMASAQHNNNNTHATWFKAGPSITSSLELRNAGTTLRAPLSNTHKQCSIGLQLIRCSCTQFCSERTINSFRELAQQIVPRRAAIRHSIPFHPRREKSILADKYFLSNFVGIQSTFFSIGNILKLCKLWEDLCTNKKTKAPSVQDGAWVGINQRIKWDTAYWT